MASLGCCVTSLGKLPGAGARAMGWEPRAPCCLPTNPSHRDRREEASPRGKEVVNPEKPISLLSYKGGRVSRKPPAGDFACFFFLTICLFFLSPPLFFSALLLLFWLISFSFIHFLFLPVLLYCLPCQSPVGCLENG